MKKKIAEQTASLQEKEKLIATHETTNSRSIPFNIQVCNNNCIILFFKIICCGFDVMFSYLGFSKRYRSLK